MAKGSHSVWPEWAPPLCRYCGERITLTGKNARGAVFSFDAINGQGHSWHPDCKQKAKVAA